jgi:hypothetical protein
MSPENGGAPQGVCSGCGATIYAEHFGRNLAGHWAGQPYCHVCLEEKMAADAQVPDEEEVAEPCAAVQIRTFHSGLTDAALADLDGRINEWLNSNPQFEIRQTTSTVGVFEGEQGGPHLILTVFYFVNS